MDILGAALQDHFEKGTADTLWVHNSYGEDEEMPVDLFFRDEKEMPELELKALELPGLWNGAMAKWNTIFVDVPITTFSPVKVVQDLLREQHQ